ncbi:MAG: hypothetical protein ACOZQL_43780 [Myxococcota bacterium]
MTLEQELMRLAQQNADVVEELPVEGQWSEWSPVPFGRPADLPPVAPSNDERSADEPLEFVPWQRRAA